MVCDGNLKKEPPMTETIKDYERIERERWEESALICPARILKHCGLIDWDVVNCEFQTCFGRFCVQNFGGQR